MAEEISNKPMSAAAAVVRNPLSVIAMFVLLVEAIATFTLIKISGIAMIALPLVWFVVLFPTLIAMLFFATLWWKHQFLYSPMEYRSDESFLTAMQRLNRVEAKQEAAELNPRTADEAESLRVVDRLIKLGDLRAAVRVGRTFLEAGQYEIAVRMFRHILEKAPSGDEDRYNVLANLGYAQIGQKEYKDAIASLEECISLVGESKSAPWQNLALAYANFRLSTDQSDDYYQNFKKRLAKGRSHRWFSESRDFYRQLYPEIADKL